MTPDSASVDMLYLSAPNGDGTFFDFVSEDVLRVFGTKAYLNTESVKEMISELTEENRIERKRMRMCCRQQIRNYRRLDWSGRFFNRSG